MVKGEYILWKIKCFVISVNRLQDAVHVPEMQVYVERNQVLQNFTGALIGLARATEGSTVPTASTYQAIIEGLFTTITNVSFDDDSISEMIKKARAEKQKFVPDCSTCGSPCGRNDDYDMEQLWDADEDIRSLKSLILFGIRGMAAYAYHAAVLGYTDE